MGNYVIEVGNYVIATPSELGNYKIADSWSSPTCSSRPCSPPPASHRNLCDFALVAMLGLLGLRIFEATGAAIADLGEEHGHRVLRVCGKGTKVVLVPLPPAVGRAIDRAIGDRTRKAHEGTLMVICL